MKKTIKLFVAIVLVFAGTLALTGCTNNSNQHDNCGFDTNECN